MQKETYLHFEPEHYIIEKPLAALGRMLDEELLTEEEEDAVLDYLGDQDITVNFSFDKFGHEYGNEDYIELGEIEFKHYDLLSEKGIDFINNHVEYLNLP